MNIQQLRLPLSHAEASALKLGDMVMLEGEAVVTIGMPTHQRMAAFIADGKPLPIDLDGGAFFHLSICSRESDGAIEPLYVNPTTSARFNAFLPSIVRTYRLCATAGKGGLDADCVRAMQDVGCVYFSIIGGASPLFTPGVAEVLETAWDDLIMQFRLTRVRLDGFGPVMVTIDAHGNSLYDRLACTAHARMPALLEKLHADRPATLSR